MEQQETIETYLQAIAIYDARLKFTHNDQKTLYRKARALERLSEIFLKQQSLQQALKYLLQALTAYDAVVDVTPNHADTLSHVGILLEQQAEMELSLGQFEQAVQTYHKALVTHDTTINEAVDNFSYHALKAGALTSLADLYSSLSQYTQAVEHYQQAIASYKTSLSLEYFKGVEFDQAQTLQKCGNCLEQLSREKVALSCYQAAMEIFNRLLPANDKHVLSLEQQIIKLSCQ